jgi:hypothetical protein
LTPVSSPTGAGEVAPAGRTLLDASVWRSRESAHAARIDRLTAGHRLRRASGQRHPVEDFLFTYYPFAPAAIRRWHPGPGVRLAAGAATERSGWRHYRVVGAHLELDHAAYLGARGDTVRFVRDLLDRTAGRPAQLGCFGLHEWAMVYRLPADQVRHHGLGLRLGSAGTDAVVEANPLRCSHFDAFRFFTQDARPRNAWQPTRATQVELDQPGCLHAGMDLFKWSMKLAPGVASELVGDCFELAFELRRLDMRASPYDVARLGLEPIPVETPEGRASYVGLQREYAARAAQLRGRLVDACTTLLAE